MIPHGNLVAANLDGASCCAFHSAADQARLLGPESRIALSSKRCSLSYVRFRLDPEKISLNERLLGFLDYRDHQKRAKCQAG